MIIVVNRLKNLRPMVIDGTIDRPRRETDIFNLQVGIDGLSDRSRFPHLIARKIISPGMCDGAARAEFLRAGDNIQDLPIVINQPGEQ